ncbi:poly-gamma-glutamate hydrolase family protein [Halobacillus sp. Marseille-Q1614]|uniref:poly-gamma-glutamate hydrolase family protein n=1 Tax=Halobacillus sp. Marseille-Q1614 TaxID=2709134 RepID=UPI001570D509|nr:poly-gamma-glutamate hydrolase family protein [Halobacillus sp. Marseille-Q1614]
MGSKYNSFSELKEENEYGKDYEVKRTERNSDVVILAIHGGGIEPGCSELTIGTSKAGSFSCYCFEGVKSKGNRALHIDSTSFNEPEALRMAESHSYTLAYHGYEDRKRKNTLIGGRDRQLRKKVLNALRAAGFHAGILLDDSPLAGIDPDNIVNKNKRGMGVQLEISTAQREAFFEENTRSRRRNTQTEEFYQYVRAVCGVF